MVIWILLHSLRPPSFRYLMLSSLFLQYYLPRLVIAGPPCHQRCSIFRLLWIWTVLCLFRLDVLQTTPCIILENFRFLSCLLVRTFFHFLLTSFWHLELCAHIVCLTFLCDYLCIPNCCHCWLCRYCLDRWCIYMIYWDTWCVLL